MLIIDSSSLSNQDIHLALLCHTYTAKADREIFIRLFADQVAGNGDYYAYVTLQKLGSGSFYEIQPRTKSTVASGITAVAFISGAISVKETDVLKVYLLGLAGDTTTPDIATEIWDADPLVQFQGIAEAGAAGTITLASTGSPASDNLVNGSVIRIRGGTGVGQARTIVGYVASSKVATVGRNWVTNPDNTSAYEIISLAVPKVDDSLQVTVGAYGAGAAPPTPPTAAAIADQVWDEAVADHVGTTTFGGKLQTAVSTPPTPPTAAAIADQVWDEAVADHVGATTFGGKLQTAVSTPPTPPTAAAIADQVWDEAVADHTTGTTFGGKLQTAVSTPPTPPTAAAIADQVWDEAAADHTTGTTFGGKLQTAVSTPPTPPTAAAIADQVWDEAVADHTTPGSAGKALGDAGGAADPLENAVPGIYPAGSAGYALGNLTGGVTGTGTYTDTITDGTNPLDGVRVQLSTDAGGSNRVYEAFTNASGLFSMNPDPGTYYRWLDLAGYTFTQGVKVVVV